MITFNNNNFTQQSGYLIVRYTTLTVKLTQCSVQSFTRLTNTYMSHSLPFKRKHFGEPIKISSSNRPTILWSSEKNFTDVDGGVL